MWSWSSRSITANHHPMLNEHCLCFKQLSSILPHTTFLISFLVFTNHIYYVFTYLISQIFGIWYYNIKLKIIMLTSKDHLKNIQLTKLSGSKISMKVHYNISTTRQDFELFHNLKISTLIIWVICWQTNNFKKMCN